MIARPLFVDTSAWVALIDLSDNLHPQAESFWLGAQERRERFLTTDYVLDETFTFLRRRRNGLARAIAFHGLVESSRLIEVAEISAGIRAAAWDIFTTYRDQVFSFTDCTSFALMRERELLEVFTFDMDFQRAGFVVRPS